MHGGGHGNEHCDAACQKILLDFAMAIVAALYYMRVLARSADLTNADYETPQLFIDAQTAFQKTALWLNGEGRKQITDEQYAAMMKIVDDNCYRASKYLIPWGNDPSITPAKAAAWTAKIQGWIKSDQDFFVPTLKLLAGMPEGEERP